MNRFIVLLLAVVGVCSGAPRGLQIPKGQEPVGPIDWECEWDGTFPHPDSCQLYIECWNNEAVLWQCTELMLFDLTYLGCNYAQYVHCDERPRPTNVPSTLSPTTPSPPTTTRDPKTTTVSTEPPPVDDFKCPDDGTFAHEKRCEYYWECYAGTAELRHCQSDYLFDLVYNGCNYPELVHCQERERPPGAKPTINPPVTTTPPPTTPTTTVYTGPTTTVDPTAPTTATTTTTLRPEFQCPPFIDGDYPDPYDCSSFYTCSGGVGFHFTCPAGLYFDPLTDSCDFPRNVDCGSRPEP